jgi:hypothetical protein
VTALALALAVVVAAVGFIWAVGRVRWLRAGLGLPVAQEEEYDPRPALLEIVEALYGPEAKAEMMAKWDDRRQV